MASQRSRRQNAGSKMYEILNKTPGTLSGLVRGQIGTNEKKIKIVEVSPIVTFNFKKNTPRDSKASKAQTTPAAKLVEKSAKSSEAQGRPGAGKRGRGKPRGQARGKAESNKNSPKEPKASPKPVPEEIVVENVVPAVKDLPKEIKCDKCGKVFPSNVTEKVLVNHIKTIHLKVMRVKRVPMPKKIAV